jgi:hypothetical protein
MLPGLILTPPGRFVADIFRVPVNWSRGKTVKEVVALCPGATEIVLGLTSIV